MTTPSLGCPRPSGTAYSSIDATLSQFSEYRDFRSGALDRAVYSKLIEQSSDELLEAGLNRDQMNLSTRFPLDDLAFVKETITSLRQQSVLPDRDFSTSGYSDWERLVASLYDHGGNMTYIFPEEALLIHALASVIKPRHAVFAGSYYGFWAIWAVREVVAAGGEVTLIDTDDTVMHLAQRNFERLGVSENVNFVVADAISYSRAELADIDFVALDAEGPKSCADEDLRDKAIYYPITQAIAPAMLPGAILLAHNVLLENVTQNAYFEERIAYNELQYARWHSFLSEQFDFRISYPSTEGVGIYRKAR